VAIFLPKLKRLLLHMPWIRRGEQRNESPPLFRGYRSR
jgi:hypothetical protein